MNTFKWPVKSLCVLVVAAALLQGCSKTENTSIQQAKTQEYIDRAESYRSQGQYRAAIIEARNALQQNPDNRAANTKLAEIFNELGQGKPAAKLIEPFAADASRSEALALAQAYWLQHKYQSALDYLTANDSRLQLTNDDSANLVRARAELQLGHIDAAQTLLGKISPKNIAANIELARIDLLRADRPAAEARIAQLVKQHPENVDVLLEASHEAEQKGDLTQAEDLLSKALIGLRETDVLLPQKAEVLQRLVTTLTKLGRSNEALVYAKTLADANPSGSQMQEKFKQALELFQAGKLDEAEPLLTEVYNESQNDSAGMLLGMIRYAKDDLNGAANYLTANVDPEVSPELAMTTLAATQLRLSQPQKLLALFDAPARARIKNPMLKMLVGIALVQTGSATEGERLIAAAQTEQPDNPAITGTLARYYVTTRQANKAIPILQSALKTHRDDGMQRLLIIAFANANQPDQAINTARELANSTPSKAENWWTLGRTALLLQRFDIADSALQTALKQKPDYLPAQLDSAQLQLQRKQPVRAETQYRDILKTHPDNIPALKGLINVFALNSPQNDVDSAVLAVADNDSARAVLAEYHLRRLQIDDAEQLLAKITDDNIAGYPSQLKQVLARLKATRALQARNIDDARRFALEGLKLNPNNADLLILLARIELGAGKSSEARKIATQLSQQSSSPEVIELQGDLAAFDKQDQSAATLYRSAWEKLPSNSLAMKVYQRLMQAKKFDDANRFLVEWEQRIPNSDAVWLIKGLQLQNAGDISGAIKSYETASARNPQNVEALNNLALLYQQVKEAKALSTAERAYSLAPKNPAVMDTYGFLLIQNRQKEKGLALLREASELVPESEEIKEHLRAAETSH